MKVYMLAVFSAFAALLCACSGPDRFDKTRIMQIDSVPRGAPIVINGVNVGKTPLSVESETNEQGCFLRQTTITAIPQEAKLHTQVISFPAYNPANPDLSLVPEKITFNMFKNPSEENNVEVEK